MSNISQRDAFWNRIYELAKNDKDIIIITADMGAPSLDKFRKDLSAQFVNVGIAEQNAITLAAGLAMSGKKPIVYAISPFITLRCLEQIRVENSIMSIPITIVGVGVGFGYDDSGPTHHLIEDYAIMRSMPNIKVNSMTDSIMAEAFADIAAENKTTNYIRIYRQYLPQIYKEKSDFKKGFSTLKNGKDACIVSCGSMTHTALEISSTLEKSALNIGVIDLYTTPVQEPILIESLKNAKKLITLEENFLPGGLGSYLSEVLIDNSISKPIKRFGLSHEKAYCYRYGGINDIRAYYGIDNKSLLSEIKKYLK